MTYACTPSDDTPLKGERNTLLSRIAACSFGIYFLHGPFMRQSAKAVAPYLDGNDFEFLCGILLILLIAIGASLLIIIAFQRLFGHRSLDHRDMTC